ncbi:hypothetical protein NQL31_003764 [Lotmaria passim]
MMPTTSMWYQGPVPTKWGSQEPAACPCVRLRAIGGGGQVWVVHMLEGLAAIHTFDTAREKACLRVVKTVRWAADVILSPSTSSTPADAPQQLPSTGPKIQHCPRCEHALSTIPGIIYHVRTHHPNATRLQVLEGENKKKWVPMRPRIHICLECCRAFITPNGLLRHRMVKHGLRAPRPLEMFIRLTCEETPDHLLVCPGLQALREKHDTETPHGAEAVADVKLANFLLEMVRHIPRPCSPMSSEGRPGVTANGTDNAISQMSLIDSSLINASSEGVWNRRRRRDGADGVPPPRSRIVQYRGGRFAVIVQDIAAV